MATGPPEFLTVKQAAALLHVSRVTIHRWIAIGSLPATKIGGRRLIAKRDVDRVLEAARTDRK
jgi:excisionase family DNA binding protein